MSTPIVAVLESIKLNEKRVPIHPDHFGLIKENTIFFQQDYAKDFGIQPGELKQYGFSLASRNELLEKADVVFLLKPTIDDLARMKAGAVLIGWCHAVQQIGIAQKAQEKKLTLIAMEAMYKNVAGKRKHLFYENNFMAGSVGIEHALSSIAFKYSQNARVSIITYGAVGQGAAYKFKELGFKNITVFSRRLERTIDNKLPNINYVTFVAKGSELWTTSGSNFKEALLDSDIIVNAIMQDVLNPCYFLSSEDLQHVDNKYIIDISCDEKLGFDFACSTTINHPVLALGNNFYYAVENIPAIQWQEISTHISKELLPLLKAFSVNLFTHQTEMILNNATEIKKGEIVNPTITEYQKRLNSLVLD